MKNLALIQLKNTGHQLLDEYIALDYSYRTSKQKIDYAYKKLARKIDLNPHFSQMVEMKHVMKANSALRHMIKKRKSKREHFGVDKIRFAPNLMELQKTFKTQIIK